MALYAENGLIGNLITGANGLTGSTFITLLLLTVLIVLVFLALGWPVEMTAILILPLHIGIVAYVSDWWSVAGCFLIYVGILIAKNFIHTY